MDAAAYTIIASICADLVMVDFGNELYAEILKRGDNFRTKTLDTTLLQMFAKFGKLSQAHQMFNDMRSRYKKLEIVSWNAIIGSHAKHGQAMEALALFEELLASGMEPDSVTFISVLFACSHAGEISKALKYFKLMDTYSITPTVEHHNCIVDMLGRAGRLTEMKKHIQKFTPNIVTWLTVLGACKSHNNIEIAEWAFSNSIKFPLEDPAAHVMMATIYSKHGRHDDRQRIWDQMSELKLSKIPGISKVEINGKLHSFVV